MKKIYIIPGMEPAKTVETMADAVAECHRLIENEGYVTEDIIVFEGVLYEYKAPTDVGTLVAV